MPDAFDPIAVMQALDRQRVTYIVIGGLGRVIHGSDELTRTRSLRPEPPGRPALEREPPGLGLEL